MLSLNYQAHMETHYKPRQSSQQFFFQLLEHLFYIDIITSVIVHIVLVYDSLAVYVVAMKLY